MLNVQGADSFGSDEDATRPLSSEVNRTGKDGAPKESNASPNDLAESDNEDETPEEDVDESVKEDMRKLEETFPGISEQFRLVNRIGEGTYPLLLRKRSSH